jgi:hypothetical protein
LSRVIIQQNDASVTYSTGGGAWGGTAAADTYASGGTYAFALASGKTATIAVANASGYTGFLVLFSGRADSTRNATISVDGVVSTLDQGGIITTGSVTSNYTLNRQCAGPYYFVGNGAHTIIITSGTGTTTFDAIEFFTAETSTVDEVLGFGHSFMYSYAGAGPVQNAKRLNLLIANYLGSTEVNHGIPAEDLCNGDWHSASPFQTTRYFNNTVIYTPGWMRAESGNLWPSPGPAQGAGALLTTTQTGNFGAQWWARKPRIALWMHGYNDTYQAQYYDPPSVAIPLANRDAAGDTTSPGASSVAYQNAGGVRGGYGLSSFFQRACEAQMRMQLNSPLTETYYFGLAPGNVGDSGNYTAAYTNTRYLWWQYSNALSEMVKLPWVKNAYYVDLLQAVTNRGGSSLYISDNAHPNEQANLLYFAEWKRVYEGIHAKGGMAASRVV